MKGSARAAAVVLTLLAFTCGFVGAAAALDVTQPAAPASRAVVQFKVLPGDSVAAVANRLQQAGLIRNALLFRALARLRRLDANLQPGAYQLSPGMTMDAIIAVLLQGAPVQQVQILIPPGLRVTQYPAYFTKLPSFDAQAFMHIVTTGVFPDGTKVSDEYWYVSAKRPNVPFALEGYLFPDTYDFDTTYDARKVIERLLDTLGEKALCRGTDAHPDAYIHNQAQCKAHARTIDVNGKGVSIFSQMESRFATKDDVTALYDALIIASLVEREARSAGAKAGVASVYYNRYLAATGVQPGPDNGGPITMDADPTVQYAIGTPADPWPKLQAAAKTVMPSNPFNSYTHPGLPPGPIAASAVDALEDAAAAPQTSYYYFITGADHQMHYAHTLAEQEQNIARYGIG